MKPLLVNTHDIKGGAARAAYRLHKGLMNIGINSIYLVREKSIDDFTILGPQTKLEKVVGKIQPYIDTISLRKYANRKKVNFSPAKVSRNIVSKISQLRPDIIHLQWITNGFISIETLKRIKQPIIWTFHDMWPFTGGCHYDESCGRYHEFCGKCPILNSTKLNDLSNRILKRKRKNWENLNITIVTISKWLANCVRKSSLFKLNRIEIIPNGLNIQTYKPIKKEIAREILVLPPKKVFILFGALSATSDTRKGFQYLHSVFKKIKNNNIKNIEILIFGASKPQKTFTFGYPIHYLGHFNDDLSLAVVYSAADVMLVPSIQEGFGQTASEAMACGTPVVAFDGTGLADIIDHKFNGYLAKPYDTKDFAKGIIWILKDQKRYCRLSYNSRRKAEMEFDVEKVSKKYVKIYEELLKR